MYLKEILINEKILILSYGDLVLFKKQFLKRVIRGCVTSEKIVKRDVYF